MSPEIQVLCFCGQQRKERCRMYLRTDLRHYRIGYIGSVAGLVTVRYPQVRGAMGSV